MKQTLFIFLLLCSGKLWAMTPVEQGIRLFNQKQYPQAEQIFQQQSDQGSAYATYWLGVTQYKNRQQFEAGQTFLKAANMGDPWAMGVLGKARLYANLPCDYLGWPCDKSWLPKAQQGWKKLAQNGVGKAEFAYNSTSREWWEYVPFYRQSRYQNIAINGTQNGGYRFLDYSIYWKDVEEKIKYLKLAANQGHAPAMLSLYYFFLKPETLDEALKWNIKAIKLGYPDAATSLYHAYSQGKKDSSGNTFIHPDVKKAYYYNKISGALGGEKEDDLRITERMRVKDQRPVVDENGRPVFEVLITKEEQAELDKQVEEFVKDITPNMFLDETSLELF
ncbi:sel1 repeat family protein [Vibrio sp. TRT 2004]|uniref:sel1 repeat family protein n=1 Tax=Vibrio sp. TRT 2004 TaxID=3418506 RepID=UPI003CF7D2A7